MKISGRIILQKPEPVPEYLTRTELAKWLFGYFRATHEAAQIATEADALMRDLAEALDYLESRHVVEADVEYGAACAKAQTALKNYQEYVK